MPMRKQLMGVYLPPSLIARIDKYIASLYITQAKKKSKSDLVEEAIKEYLNNRGT
jgi:metal-responsive CopG/Arc/MetJ family transcriptional regulator